MVSAVPGLPDGPGRGTRPVPSPAGVRSRLRPLPARRPDGGRRRLPGDAARRGTGPAAPGRGGSAGGGPVVHPDGRVPRLGRDDHPRPATRARAGRPLRRRHGRRLPPRHVRPHRADAAVAAAGRVRRRGRLAGRSRGSRPQRLLVGGAGRLDGTGRVPAGGLWQRCCHAPRRRRPGTPAGRVRRRGRPVRHSRRRPDSLDERYRPPGAPGVARRGAGRRQCRARTASTSR